MQEEWKQSKWLEERIKEANKSFKRKSAIGKAPVITLTVTLAVVLVWVIALKEEFADRYLGILVLGTLVLGGGTFLILLLKNLFKAGPSIGRKGLDKNNIMVFGREFFHKLAVNSVEADSSSAEENGKASNKAGMNSAEGEGKASSKAGMNSAEGEGKASSKAGLNSAEGEGKASSKAGLNSAEGEGKASNKAGLNSTEGEGKASSKAGLNSAEGEGKASSKAGLNSAEGKASPESERISLQEAEKEYFIRKFDREMNSEDTVSLNEGGTGGELCVFASKSFLAYECISMDGYDCLVCRLEDIRSVRTMSLPGIDSEDDEKMMYVVDLLDAEGNKIMGVAVEGKARYCFLAEMLMDRAPQIKDKAVNKRAKRH